MYFTVQSECNQLSAPHNGSVKLSSGIQCGSIADYTCNVGFELKGNGLRVCQVDETWNGTQPVCECKFNFSAVYLNYLHDYSAIDCGPLDYPKNGRVTVSLSTFYQSEATYHCNYGYVVNGSTHRTCNADGQWKPTESSCTRKLIVSQYNYSRTIHP